MHPTFRDELDFPNISLFDIITFKCLGSWFEVFLICQKFTRRYLAVKVQRLRNNACNISDKNDKKQKHNP